MQAYNKIEQQSILTKDFEQALTDIMDKLIKKSTYIALVFFFSFCFLYAASLEDRKKGQMLQDLEVIRHIFEVSYAPAFWKREHIGWELDDAFQSAKKEVLTTPSITTKQFQCIVRRFAASMKDHHVSIKFFSTERASLPFSVKGAEGRYFINWIDPLRLPPSHHSLRIGDEILEFDGSPIATVIEDLQDIEGRSSNSKTDQSLAEISLTDRLGKKGDIVPKGAVKVKTQSLATRKVVTHQFRWNYTPEQIFNPLDFLESILGFAIKKQKAIQLPLDEEGEEFSIDLQELTADRDGGLGSYKSFLPRLGPVVWSEDQNAEAEKCLCLDVYIYQHPDAGPIGYIRIPNYDLSSFEMDVFGKTIELLDREVNALVIDQLHNPGGRVACLHRLASMLTNKPLIAPYHRIKITQKDVLDAHRAIESIERYAKKLEVLEKTDNPLIKSEDEEDDDYSFQELLFLKAWCEVIIEDWNRGETLTRPTPILYFDQINPHSKYMFTKPILILVDELDFSCADFLPAILQDNKRALVFGMRTAGAGGSVKKFQFPNQHGIASCSYTASIAERVGAQKIENLGIIPDIDYTISVDDLTNNYRGYVNAVNNALSLLLHKTASDSISQN